MFLKFSQNSQENICARVSFLIKLQVWGLFFIKKEALAQCFPVNCVKILRTLFFTGHHWWLLLEVTHLCLTLSWQRPCSYRNQYIDLLCKPIDWFLYENVMVHRRLHFRQIHILFLFQRFECYTTVIVTELLYINKISFFLLLYKKVS